MTRISEEDFDAWKHNAITETFFRHLKQTRDMALERWSAEMMRDISRDDPNPSEQLQLLRFELKAKCEFIEDILSIELKDIQEDEQQGDAVPIRAGKRR